MLALREVVKTFQSNVGDTVLALDHVCLEIETGSFVVVIGTNGSGKKHTVERDCGDRGN